MMQSENIGELAKALSQCQSEMKFALKDSNNPFFKQKYANLSSVWEAVREPMTKNGLSVTQVLGIQGDVQILTTMLMHTSGQWIKSSMPVIYNQNTPQAYGSGVTYARRYSLAAIIGVVQDDDDGEAAMPKDRANPNPKQVKINNDLITEDQVRTLEELLIRSSPDFQLKFRDNLIALKINSLSAVKQRQYDTYKSKLLEAANSYQGGGDVNCQS